jgi:hypothetical protein
MGWMKTHKALLDTAAQVIHLDSPVHGVVALQLSLSLVAPSSVYHITTHKLEKIYVVYEFLDVFPDDLSGMPPHRHVEFTIELQPGMTHISRRLYKMTPKELTKLKV